MPAKVIELRDKDRRWEADELAVVFALDDDRALKRFARSAGRLIDAVYRKRHQLHLAKAAREACPAFLPDDGMPYRARMARIYEAVP